MFFTDQQLDATQTDVPQCGKRQHGFVLVLVLVLLAVLTLIGVSSMNSSSTELKATANARQHQVAFNTVQSMLEYTLSSGATLADGEGINFQTTDETPQVVDVSSVVTNVVDASALSATVNYAGCSKGVGSSLEEGKGFKYNFYRVRASGSNLKGTTTAIQSQGVRYPAAAC